jgi:hypothetical protein
MINYKTKKPYTKDDIIEIAKQQNNGYTGGFMNTDGILYDLDGKHTAEYLHSLGFEIISYRDTGRNGLVTTKEGIKISTNGYCCM